MPLCTSASVSDACRAVVIVKGKVSDYCTSTYRYIGACLTDGVTAHFNASSSDAKDGHTPSVRPGANRGAADFNLIPELPSSSKKVHETSDIWLSIEGASAHLSAYLVSSRGRTALQFKSS